jgi:hypothetical protein
MTEPKEIEGMMRVHDRLMQDELAVAGRTSGAYQDKFWASLGMEAADPLNGKGGLDATNVGKTKVEVNQVKPFIRSFMASMYHKGIQFGVSPSPRDPEAKPEEVLAMAELANDWFDDHDVEVQADMILKCALLYNATGGIKIGEEDAKKDPTESVWFEAVMPWELVFDRDARSERTMRGLGYVTYVSTLEYEALIGSAPDAEYVTFMPRSLHETHLKHEEFERQFVRVLEWYDRTEDPPVRQFYVVKTVGPEDNHPMSAGVIPVGETEEVGTWANGDAMIPLLLVVADSLPERPLYNLASVTSLYKLNFELNMLASDMATGYRRSMARVLFYLKAAGVREGVVAQIEAGVDMIMVGIENPEEMAAFKWLEQQPMHIDWLGYRKFLTESIPQVQLTSSQSRGTPGQYLSAREVAELASYTETMVGEMRKSIDEVTARLCSAYFRIVGRRMKKPITITLSDRTEVKLTKELVNRRWKVKVADGAISPQADSQKKGELVQAQPILAALAQMAADKTNPDMAGVGIALYNYFVDLFRLPETARWENLVRPEVEAPPTQQPVAPASEAIPEEAPLDPAVAGTPAGQVLSAALGEGG